MIQRKLNECYHFNYFSFSFHSDSFQLQLHVFLKFYIYKNTVNFLKSQKQMTSLNLKKITSTFERLGYNKRTKIHQLKFYSLLDQLLGQKFDPSVSSQIWEQAVRNSNDEADVGQIIEIINKAYVILIQKSAEITQTIQQLNQRKREIQINQTLRSTQKNNQISRIKKQIAQLQNDRTEFEEDLYYITTAFDLKKSEYVISPKQLASKYSSRRYDNQVATNQEQPEYATPNNIDTNNTNATNSNSLKFVFWFLLLTILFEILMIYTKKDFLNLLVIVSLSSIFILDYFDSFYVKVSLGFTSISIILDLIWLILYASQYWSPATVGIHSQSQTNFLRLIIFLTIFTMILKLLIIILLWKYRNISSDLTYSILICGKTITISANKSNPITDTISKKIVPSIQP